MGQDGRKNGVSDHAMKTIGLLGGMTWESTELYYRWINQGIKQRLGELNSAKIVLVSVNFQEINALQHRGDWAEAGRVLIESAQKVERAGADFLLICTNTMHKVAEQVEAVIQIPLLHLADITAQRIIQHEMRTVGLLGTKFTMQQDFYRARLENYGLNVIVPSEADQEKVHRIIYQELALGIVKDQSRNEYLRIVDGMRNEGAEGVIEGCTEIVMLLQQEHTNIPLFDTTAIHAEAAVNHAVS